MYYLIQPIEAATLHQAIEKAKTLYNPDNAIIVKKMDLHPDQPFDFHIEGDTITLINAEGHEIETIKGDIDEAISILKKSIWHR